MVKKWGDGVLTVEAKIQKCATITARSFLPLFSIQSLLDPNFKNKRERK